MGKRALGIFKSNWDYSNPLPQLAKQWYGEYDTSKDDPNRYSGVGKTWRGLANTYTDANKWNNYSTAGKVWRTAAGIVGAEQLAGGVVGGIGALTAGTGGADIPIIAETASTGFGAGGALVAPTIATTAGLAPEAVAGAGAVGTAAPTVAGAGGATTGLGTMGQIGQGISALSGGYQTGQSIYDRIHAQKALDELHKTPRPDYSISPELQNSYNRANGLAASGYTGQEKAAYLNNLAMQNNGNYSRSVDMAGGNLSQAIQGSINSSNTANLNQFAKSDAQLRRENIAHADALSHAMQSQRNMMIGSQQKYRDELERMYGGAIAGQKVNEANVANNAANQANMYEAINQGYYRKPPLGKTDDPYGNSNPYGNDTHLGNNFWNDPASN